MKRPREVDTVEEGLMRRLAEARAVVAAAQAELRAHREKRREEAWERKWTEESASVGKRKARDLAIIEAVLAGETSVSIGRRYRLHPGTIATIYGDFERGLRWPGHHWPYAEYPAELVAKWTRQHPDEAGQAKYWFEQAFAEVETVQPDPWPADEEEV